MRDSVHVTLNTLLALHLTPILHVPSIAAMLPAAIGSWLPDFDIRFKHRMFLHNLFAAALLAAATYALAAQLPPPLKVDPFATTMFYLFGHVLHIIEDITVTGVAPLYPFSKRRIHGPLTNEGQDAVGLLIILVLLAAQFLPSRVDPAAWLLRVMRAIARGSR